MRPICTTPVEVILILHQIESGQRRGKEGVAALLPSFSPRYRAWSSISALWQYSSSSRSFSPAYHSRQFRPPSPSSLLCLLRLSLTMGGRRQYWFPSGLGSGWRLAREGRCRRTGLRRDRTSSHSSSLLLSESTELYILLYTSSNFLSSYSRSSFSRFSQLYTNSWKTLRQCADDSVRSLLGGRLEDSCGKSKLEGVEMLFLWLKMVGVRRSSGCPSVANLGIFDAKWQLASLVSRVGVEKMVGAGPRFRQASYSRWYLASAARSRRLRSSFSRIWCSKSRRYCSWRSLRSWRDCRQCGWSWGEQQGLRSPMNSTDIIIIIRTINSNRRPSPPQLMLQCPSTDRRAALTRKGSSTYRQQL